MSGRRPAGGKNFTPAALPPRLEINHFQVHAPKSLPFVDTRRESQATLSACRHELRLPLGHPKGDCAEGRALLADAEAQVTLAAADAFGCAFHLQGAPRKIGRWLSMPYGSSQSMSFRSPGVKTLNGNSASRTIRGVGNPWLKWRDAWAQKSGRKHPRFPAGS